VVNKFCIYNDKTYKLVVCTNEHVQRRHV